jgi:hypothetical protein
MSVSGHPDDQEGGRTTWQMSRCSTVSSGRGFAGQDVLADIGRMAVGLVPCSDWVSRVPYGCRTDKTQKMPTQNVSDGWATARADQWPLADRFRRTHCARRDYCDKALEWPAVPLHSYPSMERIRRTLSDHLGRKSWAGSIVAAKEHGACCRSPEVRIELDRSTATLADSARSPLSQ